MAIVTILTILTTAIVVVLVGASMGSAQMRRLFESEKVALLRRGRSSVPRMIEPSDLAGVPAPVRRYVEASHVVGKIRPKVAVLWQQGGIRTAPDKPWVPYRSEQAYAMDPPGFVWLARARLAPSIALMARDRYVDGAGNMLIRLLGFIPIADSRGPEIDQGAGLRYWGEVLAFPEMVLDPHLRWEPIDDRRARFVVKETSPELSAVVELDEQGLMMATHAQRFRDVGGKAVLTPWSGYFRQWKTIDGRLFPSSWESVWHLTDGHLPAVRLEVTKIVTE